MNKFDNENAVWTVTVATLASTGTSPAGGGIKEKDPAGGGKEMDPCAFA